MPVEGYEYNCSVLYYREKDMISLESIFSSSTYVDEAFDRPRWWKEGSHFTTLKKVRSSESSAPLTASDLTATTTSAGASGMYVNEVMWHDAATGAVEPLVTLSQLVPPGRETPLLIDNYSTSADRSKVLIFTESERVWRINTRGAYWVLDLTASPDSPERLVQLGATFTNPKGLMFATFSPDASKVAYVYENNIYVEDLRSHIYKALTSDGNEDIINGTFDWVYEEEFGMYCGFRWSPDGSSIAYWRLDQTDVPVVNIINNTDEMYPKLNPIHYPKAGDKNASFRIGVVASDGGSTLWLSLPGDSRDDYVADMDFHRSGKIVMQQVWRLYTISFLH